MAKFNVGDRVVVVDNEDNDDFYDIGDAGTVLEVNGSELYVQFDLHRVDDGQWYVGDYMVEAE